MHNLIKKILLYILFYKCEARPRVIYLVLLICICIMLPKKSMKSLSSWIC